MIIDYNNKEYQKRILSSPTGIACLCATLGTADDDCLATLLRSQNHLPIYMTAAIKDEQKRRENLNQNTAIECKALLFARLHQQEMRTAEIGNMDWAEIDNKNVDLPGEVCPSPTSDSSNCLLGPAYPSQTDSSILNSESVADTLPAIPLFPHIVSTYDDILNDHEAETILSLEARKIANKNLFDPILPGSVADRIAERLAKKVIAQLDKDKPMSLKGKLPISLEEFFEMDNINHRHSQR